MIYWGENRSETRWVPFLEGAGSSNGLEQEEDGELIKLTEASMYERFDLNELDRSAPPFLKWLVEGKLEELEFMRGKLVTFVGESEQGRTKGREGRDD